MRLIDADELMRKYHVSPVWDSWLEINNAPTIDAVPVVRCKDCKYAELRFATNGDIAEHALCKRLVKCGVNIVLIVQLTDFCSLGEQRKNWRNQNEI